MDWRPWVRRTTALAFATATAYRHLRVECVRCLPMGHAWPYGSWTR